MTYSAGVGRKLNSLYQGMASAVALGTTWSSYQGMASAVPNHDRKKNGFSR